MPNVAMLLNLSLIQDVLPRPPKSRPSAESAPPLRPRRAILNTVTWISQTVSDAALDPDISLPFPVELVIRDVPRSHQSPNARAKEAWKQKGRIDCQCARGDAARLLLPRQPKPGGHDLLFPAGRN